MTHCLISPPQGPEHKLACSPLFKTEACTSWLKETWWAAAFTGGLLSIIHPEQYLLGRMALLEVANRPEECSAPDDIMSALGLWASPFTGVSVMVNRVTPVHRDVQGRDSWMDLLLTVGPYTGCRMEFRSLGIRAVYDTGTVVGVCSKVVPHAASEWSGERACIAYYMRDNVHARLGIPSGTWMNLNTM